MTFKEYFSINNYCPLPSCKAKMGYNGYYYCSNYSSHINYYQNIRIVHLTLDGFICKMYEDAGAFKATLFTNNGNKILFEMKNKTFEEIIKAFMKISNIKTFL